MFCLGIVYVIFPNPKIGHKQLHWSLWAEPEALSEMSKGAQDLRLPVAPPNPIPPYNRQCSAFLGLYLFLCEDIWAFPKNRGPLFGSPYNKSPTILGSILGPPIVGNSHLV